MQKLVLLTFSKKFKDAAVARLLPLESSSLKAVSQKVDINVTTLACHCVGLA